MTRRTARNRRPYVSASQEKARREARNGLALCIVAGAPLLALVVAAINAGATL